MEEHLSPRERWVRKNKVAAHPTDADSRECKMFGPYIATRGAHKEYGATRDEAISRLAQTLWIKENIRNLDYGSGMNCGANRPTVGTNPPLFDE